MSKFTFLKSYEDWRTCIEKSCGIPLTQSFIKQRLLILRNAESEETVRFIEHYGSQHHYEVISWFEKAVSDKRTLEK